MEESYKSHSEVSEHMVMTYGMSDTLLSSGLLTQIHALTIQDKKCLISYITQEVANDDDGGDEAEWNAIDNDLPPYSLDEIYARIAESHQQYLRGEYITAEESDRMLKQEFLWLE